MRTSGFRIAVFVLLFSRPATAQQLVNAFPNLIFTNPVFLTNSSDGTNRIFVVQQNGLIKVFPNDSAVSAATTYLDISSRISTGSERGLLGLAFHPNYASNGYFYVDYTQAGTGRTIVARYSVSAGDPNLADSASELVLLNIYQPYSNHNGGMVMFGQDGYLYIGMGDGGSAGDPANRAQNLDSLLGKILRIDVNNPSPPLNYGIPPDNPLVGSGHREEIYAWGMRNPWRFSQDPVTGEIWVGDVGQNSWEEVDSLGIGKNYGWRCYEGNAPYNTAGCGPTSLYTFPVKVYSHSFGCSVTGGYIYRGQLRRGLVGRYIYGDYCSGRIWQFRYENGLLVSDSLLLTAPFSISSFGIDEDRELYVCNYSSSGSVYRFSTIIPPAVTLVEPEDGANTSTRFLTFRWRSALNALYYWLESGFDSTFATIARRDTALTDTSLAVNDILRDTTYYWRVRARGASGDGPFSPVRMFTSYILPAAPVLVSPPDSSAQMPDSVQFVWRSISGAYHYWFELSSDPGFGTFVSRDTTVVDSSKIVTDLPQLQWLYWRVRARNGAGYGPYSNPGIFFSQEALGVGDHPFHPTIYALHQNYPNPFNPSTRISFDLAQPSAVRLSIWNMLGQEVGVLVDGFRQPGRYSVEFDARRLPSGTYFYRLRANGFAAMRKMILMK